MVKSSHHFLFLCRPRTTIDLRPIRKIIDWIAVLEDAIGVAIYQPHKDALIEEDHSPVESVHLGTPKLRKARAAAIADHTNMA